MPVFLRLYNIHVTVTILVSVVVAGRIRVAAGVTARVRITTGITIKIAVHRMMLTGVHVTVLRSVVLRRMHILHHFWHLLPVKGRSSS